MPLPATPRNWTTSELVTASIMNTHVRDQFSYVGDTLDALLAAKVIIIGFGRLGGPVIPTGLHRYVHVPVALTVTAWHLIADQAGNLVVDVWAEDYASSPPTVADSIAGTEKPTLSGVQKNQDTSLSSWGAIAAGDVLGFHIDSSATVTHATLTLHCELA